MTAQPDDELVRRLLYLLARDAVAAHGALVTSWAAALEVHRQVLAAEREARAMSQPTTEEQVEP